VDKPHKFSYLPGAIQLVAIPLILSLVGVRNFYIFNSFRIFDNFDPNRLQLTAEDAYPLPNGRPRGDKDISSVKFYQNQIQQKTDITPIWMIQKNNKYILLDGAHRIVASYIENIKHLNAYIIHLSKIN
jgi:hypothetical protein